MNESQPNKSVSLRRGLWAAIFVAGVLAVAMLDIWPSDTSLEAQEPSAGTVRLVIDYGDGVEKHFTRITWEPEMTVLDAMEQAKRSKHGITFEHRGRGETAFLVKIDDLENEAGGQDSRNWSYSVNDKPATKSFGIYEPDKNDVIVWKFGPFEPNP